jgi:NTP pyrophosphatase (non-canonical NTP hydrolase)|uniref:Nucleotide pyrophosphohydrolase domain protein n=1 Tax=uncultured virus TaxID=340016 RepID=A0A0A0V4I6_9VIRU|nr:nucleotide pyrophosphohydrolase domain protein [uncultured virus]
MINEDDLEGFGYYGDSLSFNDYQRKASRTAIYSMAYQILYPALGLAGEAGEVANKVKKLLRDSTKLDRSAIADELGDVLWYISALCRDLNIDMGDVAKRNLEKLYDRMERGTLGGSGDKR